LPKKDKKEEPDSYKTIPCPKCKLNAEAESCPVCKGKCVLTLKKIKKPPKDALYARLSQYFSN
jgi:hypothetical protein